MISKVKKKQACFLPGLFEPSGVNEMIRLGSEYRGGHVVATDAVANSRALLSLGLYNDCEFELDFAAMARLSRLHCYAPTLDGKDLKKTYLRARIGNLFRRTENRRRLIASYKNYRNLFEGENRSFIHLRQPVGLGTGQLPLDDAISAIGAESGSLFIKCVLTGSEYEILDQIIEHNEDLSGIVIAFHDVPAHMREIQVFLTAMKNFMWLDNTAADNSAGLNHEGVPNNIEISMSSRHGTIPPISIAGATTKYKLLHAPNDPAIMDLEIVYV